MNVEEMIFRVKIRGQAGRRPDLLVRERCRLPRSGIRRCTKAAEILDPPVHGRGRDLLASRSLASEAVRDRTLLFQGEALRGLLLSCSSNAFNNLINLMSFGVQRWPLQKTIFLQDLSG